MTEAEREKMRRDDHDMLIRMDGCLKNIAAEQKEQGAQIKDLYDRVTPLSQWIGTANSGLKLFSYLGAIVVVISLLWNGVATGVTLLMRVVTQPQIQSHVLIDPDAPTPNDQVRRPE